MTAGDNHNNNFDEFKGDIEAAERRVAREIDPGARALVLAIAVFVLLLSFVLPHTGAAKGWDVLAGDDIAISEGISLPSRVFVWFALVFSVGFSMLALLTRRWAVAWIAVIVLTFHWARVVWSRTALQLAAEQERRRAVAKRQNRGLLESLDDDRDTGSDGPEKT